MKYSPRGVIPQDKVRQVTQEILEFFITHCEHYGFGVWAVIYKQIINFQRISMKLKPFCQQ